jgi:hypothetical protein
MAVQVIDRTIQAFGAEGLSQDQPLAHLWAGVRALRVADVSLFLIVTHLETDFILLRVLTLYVSFFS